MHTDRRAILQLVAMGRITSAEAERLLIACNDERETLSVLAVCVAVACLAQLHLGRLVTDLLHAAHSFIPGSLLSLHHALSLVARLFGGML